MAEIGMIKEMWPSAKVSICWWHMWHAVRERLTKTKLSTTPYSKKRAKAAHAAFSFIDADFRPTGQPNQTEYEGGKLKGEEEEEEVVPDRPWATQTTIKLPPLSQPVITPPSQIPEELGNNEDDKEKDSRREFCPKQHREQIVNMLEDAYCAHPLIPGFAANHPAAIHEWAVCRIYNLCAEHDLCGLWAYLWMNWLRLERWSLWAHSACPDMIPILKTTMMVESQLV